jgi:hypothetical protein
MSHATPGSVDLVFSGFNLTGTLVEQFGDERKLAILAPLRCQCDHHASLSMYPGRRWHNSERRMTVQ